MERIFLDNIVVDGNGMWYGMMVSLFFLTIFAV